MDRFSQLNLMLIGKTGNGKSSTGNSILRRKCFRASGSATSVTHKVDFEMGKFDGRKLKVVDVPGVSDTAVANKKGAEVVFNCLQQAIYLCPEGYNAFILVIKYGSRSTKEEWETLQFLKKVFGQNFVRDHCVIVMSGGDTFEYDKAEGSNFKTWCSQQTGKFKELLQECNNRIVLFDNFTKDNYVKSKQLLKLLKEIDQLGSNGQKYRDINFNLAKESRERLRVENKYAELKEESYLASSELLDKLEKVQSSNDHKMKIGPLDKILVKDSELHKRLVEADDGSEVLRELIETAKSIESIAKEERKMSQKFAEEEENIKLQKEELQEQQAKLEQEKKRIEQMKENERQKAAEEQEKQQREIEKLRQEQEEREKRIKKEILEAKEAQMKKLDQQEVKQKETREDLTVKQAVDYASSWLPGGNYLKKVYDGGNALYNWWYGK